MADTIMADAEFFDSMLNLIPVTYYYPPVEDELDRFSYKKGAVTGESSQGNKKRKGAPLDAKQTKKQAKKAKKEARQDMFDPDNYRTVVDIQRTALGNKSKPTSISPSFPVAQTTVPKAGPKAKGRNQKPVPRNGPIPAASTETRTLAGSMAELKQRLRQKINQLSNKRKQDPTKQAKLDLRKASRAAKVAANGGPSQPTPAPKKVKAKKAKAVAATPTPAAAAAMRESAPVDADEEVSFTFQALKKVEKSYGRNKKRERDDVALEKAIKYKELIARLEKEDPEKAALIKQRTAARTAALRLEGVTVKDDIKLLKKNIKRAEASKKRSQKAWAEKGREIKSTMKARQLEREKNLKDRAANTKKALRRKSRPGFEGASNFIN